MESEVNISDLGLFDTHCHLTALTHKPLEEVLSSAAKSGVTRLLCVGSIDGVNSALPALNLAKEHSFIWAAAGIHPHDAEQFTTFKPLEELAEDPRVVAIGETGLDFYRDWAPADKQRALFIDTIAAARNLKKPLIIHCRDALDETFELLKNNQADQVGGVFHCYSGDAEFAKKLEQLNFLVSFPGSLTFKKAQLVQNAAADIPLRQIMLETDCPYMAPEPYRGKPSEPAHVLQIATKLAEIKQLSLTEVARDTSKNACRLFGIK